ncbi:hypothetical protein DRE_07660 [Drechslerella stenobrocha 248]|uniref:Uncharacterized protein n=1 Tax=Drechslerella stenobrocha 248 TaxID=1043628 RepID=W7HTZ0_9PEZI|nr:hypothetical protein DRE_07660 [Drechslerella stenobrocha 248]
MPTHHQRPSSQTTPKLPSDDPKQQEAELPTADHEDQLQAKEDLREAAKVLLPVSPDTADASSETPKEAAAPEPPDGVLLSHSVHASLMSELADLRKRVSDVQKLHKASQTRVREWEAYRVSMDKYIQQLSKDRQVLVERLTTSEQAAAERQQQSANMFKQLNSTNADWQAHAQRLENQVKQLERDKADALMQVVQQSDRANAAEDDKKRSLVASQEEARRAQVAMTADFDGRAKAYEMMTTQMSTHIEHLEKHEKHRIAQVSDLEAERQRLQNENTGLKATVEDWKLQHGAVSSARSAATKELQLSRARVVNLEAEANKTKLQLEEGERVKAELADTQQKLERMKDTEKTLEQFVSTATEEKDKLRELLKASTAARGRLGAALTEAEGKVADGEKKIKMLEKANEAQKKRMYMLGQRMAEKVDWWEGQLRPQRATA